MITTLIFTITFILTVWCFLNAKENYMPSLGTDQVLPIIGICVISYLLVWFIPNITLVGILTYGFYRFWFRKI